MCSCEEYEKAALLIEDKEGEVLAKLIWSCFEKQLEDGRPHPCSEVIRGIGESLGLVQADGIQMLQALKPLVIGTEHTYEIRNNHFVRADVDMVRLRILEQIGMQLNGMRKQICALQSQMTDLCACGEKVCAAYDSDSLPIYKQTWDHMDICVEDIGSWMACVEEYANACLKRITIG